MSGEGQMSVTVGKNERDLWCVYLDGEMVSSHRDRAAAATAANNHIWPGEAA